MASGAPSKPHPEEDAKNQPVFIADPESIARDNARLLFWVGEESSESEDEEEVTRLNEEIKKLGVTTREEVIQFYTKKLMRAKSHKECLWTGCADEFGGGKLLDFDTREQLYCHIIVDHYKGKDFVCHWKGCQKGLASKDSWSRHVCTEIDFWPFICEVCRRALVKEHKFLVHMTECQSQRPADWKKLLEDKEKKEEIIIVPPQVSTTFKTDSKVRYRKLKYNVHLEHYVTGCVEASCEKMALSRTDYCTTHGGRNDNIWNVVAPFPLFYVQAEDKVTEGDYYYRRETLSKFTGEWNHVCAYDNCFRPFNQYQAPFCSITCNKEYIRRRDNSLRQIELNAIAAVMSGQVASSSSSPNVTPPPPPPENEIIVKKRLDTLSDPTKRYIRHVKWRIDAPRGQLVPDGFRQECLVDSCDSWSLGQLCNTHNQQRSATSHELKRKHDQEPPFFMANPHVKQWRVGGWYWTRELFDNNKRGAKNEWIRLCWNWECQSLIGNRTIGFCSLSACQQKADFFPRVLSAQAARGKRNRSRSDDRSNKKNINKVVDPDTL